MVPLWRSAKSIKADDARHDDDFSSDLCCIELAPASLRSDVNAAGGQGRSLASVIRHNDRKRALPLRVCPLIVRLGVAGKGFGVSVHLSDASQTELQEVHCSFTHGGGCDTKGIPSTLRPGNGNRRDDAMTIEVDPVEVGNVFSVAPIACEEAHEIPPYCTRKNYDLAGPP